MCIKKIDFLSPKITLYFKGSYKHSSIFSGIITIMSYLTILFCIIYYTLDFIDRSNPTIYFFNRYAEEVGSFPLNLSSVFHYVNLISTSKDKANLTFDFNSISIYGITRNIDSYMRDSDFSNMNHWVYNLCDDKDYNIESFHNIIDKKTFLRSACIEKYYNYIQHKYYYIGESGFKWPSLDHGMSNPNGTTYGIVVEKCKNSTLKNTCNSNEKVNSFFKKYAISLNFFDQYADVLNYKEPFLKYINSISSGMTLGKTITVNNLNLNPSLTRTHNGIFLDNLVEEKSYSFVQNEKKTIEISEDKNIVASFYFWMQNNMIYNERYYKKFQDLLSNIGGLGSFILLIGYFINSFVSYYIILLDTEDLVFNIEKLNFDKDIQKKRATITRNKETIFHISNKNNKINLENSNISLINNNSNKNETDKREMFISKRNKEIKDINKVNNFNKENNFNLNINVKKFTASPHLPNNKSFKENKKIKDISMVESNSENLVRTVALEKSFFEIKDGENKIIPRPKKRENFTWFNYILYIILFKTRNSYIKFYENFRTQILSEENCWQNSLDIYKLLKFSKIQKTNPFELLN